MGQCMGGLLRQRNFRLFWVGESISEFGNSVTIVVIPLVAIDTLHASTFIVTLLTAMVWLPWVIIGVPAGAWVDRLPPRPVMLASDAISLAVYASVPVAAWCGVLTVAQLIAVTLIAGAASVFFNSAYQVLLPAVVDEPDLTEANAKLMGSREVAQIGGPGLGGLLAQAAGPVTGLLADAASFAVSFCCLAAMQSPRERRSGGPAAGGVLDGLRFTWRDPYLRAMTAFSSLGNLALTGVEALLVIFLVRTVALSRQRPASSWQASALAASSAHLSPGHWDDDSAQRGPFFSPSPAACASRRCSRSRTRDLGSRLPSWR
ncbi:MAG TPA: MFS transporter [Streptosporangiaceae bacterium]